MSVKIPNEKISCWTIFTHRHIYIDIYSSIDIQHYLQAYMSHKLLLPMMIIVGM